MKILIAVDGSHFTKRMLAWLAVHDEIVGRRDGAMAVLTVVPRFPRYATLMDQLDPGPMQQQASEAVLQPIRQFCKQQDWDAAFSYRSGDPASCIAEEAESGGFDLLVLGSHGHTSLVGVVLGSVTTAVLARCRTPMLIIR